MLDKIFQERRHGSTVRREIIAGGTTFLTAAYIIFVNPAILSLAGMDKGHWRTFLLMPLTYSIATGLAFGFLSYVLLRLLHGRIAECNLFLLLAAAVSLISLAV